MRQLSRRYMEIIFDIETYGCGSEPSFNDKVIAIGLKYCYSNRYKILKEWEDSEEGILKEFKNILDNYVNQKNSRVKIIGFNILSFDIPLLKSRFMRYHIMDLVSFSEYWKKLIVIDLKQVLAIFNNLSFYRLRLKNIANIFNEFLRKYWSDFKDITIPCLKGENYEIPKLYQEGRFEEIEEHLKADLDVEEAIYLLLKRISTCEPSKFSQYCEEIKKLLNNF